MSNQTIDGVPRELALRLLLGNGSELARARKELRALLDAPVPDNDDIESERGEALSIYDDAMDACAEVGRDGVPGDVIREMNDELVTLRAAQPHGEPVAWLNVATGHVTTSAVVVMDWDDEKEQVKSLYAEQTAPVSAK